MAIIGPNLPLVNTGGRVVRLVSGGEVDTDTTAVEVFAVESFDSGGSAFNVAHGDEAESARATGASIVDNDDLVNGSDGVKLVLEVLLERADRQTENTEDGGRFNVGRSVTGLGWRSAASVGARAWRRAGAGAVTVASVASVVSVVASSGRRS